MNKEEQAILLLEDGKCFFGKAAGKKGKTFGKVVFNTSMVGYQQLLTDPANHSLIVVQTFPLIGNYGINQYDYTTDTAHLAGYVVRELCDNPSNYRCMQSLPDFLDKNKVVALTEIDTRSLTRYIRENGEMKGVIASGEVNIDELKKELAGWQDEPCSTEGFKSAAAIGIIGGEPPAFKLSMLDIGAGKDFYLTLCNRGADLNICSPDMGAEDILANKPDGIVISNGGGNPADYKEAIKTIKELAKSGIPMLGVGLGHLVMALAFGGETQTMHCGHRGANQPVYRNENGRTYITSQNHGYIVSDKRLPSGAVVSYKNANDATVEGLSYPEINAWSVQFMPDTVKGVQSTAFIYDDFIEAVMKKKGGVN